MALRQADKGFCNHQAIYHDFTITLPRNQKTPGQSAEAIKAQTMIFQSQLEEVQKRTYYFECSTFLTCFNATIEALRAEYYNLLEVHDIYREVLGLQLQIQTAGPPEAHPSFPTLCHNSGVTELSYFINPLFKMAGHLQIFEQYRHSIPPNTLQHELGLLANQLMALFDVIFSFSIFAQASNNKLRYVRGFGEHMQYSTRCIPQEFKPYYDIPRKPRVEQAPAHCCSCDHFVFPSTVMTNEVLSGNKDVLCHMCSVKPHKSKKSKRSQSNSYRSSANDDSGIGLSGVGLSSKPTTSPLPPSSE